MRWRPGVLPVRAGSREAGKIGRVRQCGQNQRNYRPARWDEAFGGTTALRDVSFGLHAGEVLALLGENGAGKSTCVKLLAGVHPPSRGSIVIEGAPTAFASPLEAQQAGVAVMHQHPGLFPDLSVAENVFMGHMPSGVWGVTMPPWRARPRRCSRPSACLSTWARSSVGCGPRTAAGRDRPRPDAESAGPHHGRADGGALAREVERLFEVVATLRRQGVAMMFVGHRMDEIFRIADRIAVLRDGHLVGVEAAAVLSRDRAISMMVGRQLSALYPHRGALQGEVRSRWTP